MRNMNVKFERLDDDGTQLETYSVSVDGFQVGEFELTAGGLDFASINSWKWDSEFCPEEFCKANDYAWNGEFATLNEIAKNIRNRVSDTFWQKTITGLSKIKAPA